MSFIAPKNLVVLISVSFVEFYDRSTINAILSMTDLAKSKHILFIHFSRYKKPFFLETISRPYLREPCEIKGCPDEVLKKLEKDKDDATKRINYFADRVKSVVNSAQKGVTEKLEERHKTVVGQISKVLKEVQEAQSLTGNLTEKALSVLQGCLTVYDVRDNSEFVFGTIKRCFEKTVDCYSLESFLASLPHDEMLAVVNEVKRCLISICKFK